MQTLALMLAAVSLSLAIGIPLGVWPAAPTASTGRSRRARRDADHPGVRLPDAGRDPVLGRPRAAVITTMIYAMPPAVRITALGIRGVADEHGRGRRLAGRDAHAGARQGAAAARAPDAPAVRQPDDHVGAQHGRDRGLIGGGGLGDTIISCLNSNPALAILGGVAIVFLAIALDRVTEAVAERTDPAHASPRRRRPDAGACAWHRSRGASRWSPSSLSRGCSAPVPPTRADRARRLLARDPARARLRPEPDDVPVPRHHELVGDFLVASCSSRSHVHGRDAVVHDARRAHRDRVRRWRAAAGDHVGADVRAIGVMGVWRRRDGHGLAGDRGDGADARRSASWSGSGRRRAAGVSALLRPILDALQTLPQFVYLVPFVALFTISGVPGVIASVLYAFPVVIRLVERGLRDVSATAVEAAGVVRRDPPAAAAQGEDPARPRRDHARHQPGHHHGARVVVIVGPRRAGRARLRRRVGLAAEPVRRSASSRRSRSCARHRPRSHHPAGAERGRGSHVTSVREPPRRAPGNNMEGRTCR